MQYLAVSFAFFSSFSLLLGGCVAARKVFDKMSEQREKKKQKYQKVDVIGEGSGCDLVMSEHTPMESNGGGPGKQTLEQELVHEMSEQTQKELSQCKGKGVVGSERDGGLVAKTRIDHQEQPPTHDAIAVNPLEEQEGDSEGEVAKPPHGIVLSSDSRRRLRWTPELHTHFVKAVKELGGAQKATPKLLLREMGIEGLTLHQLKSHLQKYRLGKYAITEWERLKEVKKGKGASCSTVSKGASGSSSQTIGKHRNCSAAAPKAHKEVKGQLYLKLEAERRLRMRQEAERRYLDSAMGSAYKVLYDQYLKGKTKDDAGLGGYDFPSIGNMLPAQPSNHNMFYANPAAPYRVNDTANFQYNLGKQPDSTQPQGPTHYPYAPSLASYGHSANFAPGGFSALDGSAYRLAESAQPGCSMASYGFPTNVAPEGFPAFDGSAYQFGVANQLDSTQPQMSGLSATGCSLANSYELLHPMNLAPEGFSTADGSAYQLADTVESQFGMANQSSYITQPQSAAQFSAGCSLANQSSYIAQPQSAIQFSPGSSLANQSSYFTQPQSATQFSAGCSLENQSSYIAQPQSAAQFSAGYSLANQSSYITQPQSATQLSAGCSLANQSSYIAQPQNATQFSSAGCSLANQSSYIAQPQNATQFSSAGCSLANQSSYITQPQNATQFSSAGCSQANQSSYIAQPQSATQFSAGCSLANQSPYITQPHSATQLAAGCSPTSYGDSTNVASDGFSTFAGPSYQLDDAGQVQYGMAQQADSIQPENVTQLAAMGCSASSTGLPENLAPEVFPTEGALDGNPMSFSEDPIEAFLMWDRFDMDNQANGFGFTDGNLV